MSYSITNNLELLLNKIKIIKDQDKKITNITFL